MESFETVLSEVHINYESSVIKKLPSINVTQRDKNNEIEVVVSKVKFKKLNTDFSKGISLKQPDLDEDGDSDVVRAPSEWEIIMLEHSLATPLSYVGLQVWNGALLLGDFILNKCNEWKNQTVLELGSGTGLCSILLGMSARIVYCTDVGDEVLDLCVRNMELNSNFIQNNNVFVRELDWLKDNPFELLDGNAKSPYSWKPSDEEEFKNIKYIFASDVIYHEKLIRAFFNVIRKIVKKNSGCVLYLSFEKRVVFTLEDLDEVAPMYEDLCKEVKTLCSEDSRWSVKPIEIDFPQCFQYDRTKYLQLWKIALEN